MPILWFLFFVYFWFKVAEIVLTFFAGLINEKHRLKDDKYKQAQAGLEREIIKYREYLASPQHLAATAILNEDEDEDDQQKDRRHSR